MRRWRRLRPRCWLLRIAHHCPQGRRQRCCGAASCRAQPDRRHACWCCCLQRKRGWIDASRRNCSQRAGVRFAVFDGLIDEWAAPWYWRRVAAWCPSSPCSFRASGYYLEIPRISPIVSTQRNFWLGGCTPTSRSWGMMLELSMCARPRRPSHSCCRHGGLGASRGGVRFDACRSA